MTENRITALTRDPNAMTGKALRRSGFIPAIYYSRAGETRCLQFERNELQNLLRHEIGILYVDLNGEELSCVIREVQRHPVRRDVLHIDLMGVVKGQKMKAHVPIHIVGTAKGIKEGGTMDLVLREVEVECLPSRLPSYIDVDVTDLGVNDGFRIGEIQLEEVAILGDPHTIIVHIVPPRTTTEPVPGAETAEAAEPEVIRERKSEEE